MSAGPLQKILWLIIPTAALGCVRSEHPLVDEQDSIVDVDLIGEWFVEDDKVNSFWIRRKPASENALEAFTGDDDHVDLLLWRAGGKRYLCVECPESHSYVVCRYELQSKDEVIIYALDAPATLRAIQAKELTGRKGFGLLRDDAILSETPAGLRAYLEKHCNNCFERDASLVVKRFNKHAR